MLIHQAPCLSFSSWVPGRSSYANLPPFSLAQTEGVGEPWFGFLKSLLLADPGIRVKLGICWGCLCARLRGADPLPALRALPSGAEGTKTLHL